MHTNIHHILYSVILDIDIHQHYVGRFSAPTEAVLQHTKEELAKTIIYLASLPPTQKQDKKIMAALNSDPNATQAEKGKSILNCLTKGQKIDALLLLEASEKNAANLPTQDELDDFFNNGNPNGMSFSPDLWRPLRNAGVLPLPGEDPPTVVEDILEENKDEGDID